MRFMGGGGRRRARDYMRYVSDGGEKYWVDGEAVMDTVEERPVEVVGPTFSTNPTLDMTREEAERQHSLERAYGESLERIYRGGITPARVLSDDESPPGEAPFGHHEFISPTPPMFFDEASDAIQPLTEALPEKTLKLFPGKKVRVRKIKEGTLFGPVNFIKEMEEWIGETVTIHTVRERGRDEEVRFTIEEDDGHWTWTVGMFEEIIETKMKYKIIITKDKEDKLIMIT